MYELVGPCLASMVEHAGTAQVQCKVLNRRTVSRTREHASRSRCAAPPRRSHRAMRRGGFLRCRRRHEAAGRTGRIARKAGQKWPESPHRPGHPCVLRRRMAAAAPGPGLATWRARRRSARGPRRWPEIRNRLRPRSLSKAETTRRGPGTLFEPEGIQCIIELVHTDALVPDATMNAAGRARRTRSGPERRSIVERSAGILWM